jgi:O-antigen/teichoic acid export membrane protein
MNKAKIINSFLWKLLERGGNQGIQLVLSIVLARKLLPEDYGNIAIVMIFISIFSELVQSGFSKALIQKKIIDDIDYSSVFYLSLSIATLLYCVLFFSAPSIARFYSKSIIIPIIRILSLTLILNALSSIQNAIAERLLHFKKIFISNTIAIALSGTIGILLAYNNFGIWSLVVQYILYQIILITILFVTIKWRPKAVFSLKRVKLLFSFGFKLLISSLINTLYLNVTGLIIGKIYKSSMLGFYQKGQQFPLLIAGNIDNSIQAVMFPVLSSHQDDKQVVKNIVRHSIITSSFLICPIMVGLATIAEPLVKVLLTEKWLPSVPFLQLFCGLYILWPIHTTNLQAINAMGRSDIYLKLEIIKKIIGISILSISVFHGVYAILLGQIISGLIASFINVYPNKKLLSYGYFEQMRDMIPSLLLSLVMGAIVYSIKWSGLDGVILLIVQICIGVIIYIGISKVFNRNSLEYITNIIKDLFMQRRRVK